jgi:hypothetical protein
MIFFVAPLATFAQSTTQTPPPAGTTQQQTPPGTPPPSTTQLPPNSSSAPVRPDNEAQQSTQPQTGVEQQRQQTQPNTQGPRPPSPQVAPSSQQTAPGQQQPQTATPAGTTAPQTATPQTGTPGAPASGVPQTPAQNVGVTGGIAPAELPVEPPPVAPNFKAQERPLPSAERVGVDINDQTPMTLNEAIGLALRNNNDIDGSRINVQIAEFQLSAARGVYDPVFSSESYFESRTSSISPRRASRPTTRT